eukprot:COSAG03_NODE_5020_length_1361_cov_147.159271_2_plen_115_part_00
MTTLLATVSWVNYPMPGPLQVESPLPNTRATKASERASERVPQRHRLVPVPILLAVAGPQLYRCELVCVCVCVCVCPAPIGTHNLRLVATTARHHVTEPYHVSAAAAAVAAVAA